MLTPEEIKELESIENRPYFLDFYKRIVNYSSTEASRRNYQARLDYLKLLELLDKE